MAFVQKVNHLPESLEPQRKNEKENLSTEKNKKIQTVVNLSSVTLTKTEETVLSKGLNFCPVPSKINRLELDKDLDNFARRLRLKEFFYQTGRKKLQDADMSDSDEDGNNDDITIQLFKKKSDWNPPKSKNDNLEAFINTTKSEIKSNLLPNKKINNLSKNERTAIKNLSERNDITIKPADKGSAVVVMDTQQYIEEGNRQLKNTNFYKQLQSDPTDSITTEIRNILAEMHENGHIDKDTFNYLVPENCSPGRFYMLPKLHKEGIPGRPIVSANGHPTEKISEFVDYHLRPFVKALPSYIQDTTDYLRKMQNLNPLPSNTILATMDVSSLYTNIPQDEGIAACEKVWNTRQNKSPPTECLVKLLTLVLKNNNFVFNGQHYIQINGTSMGTKMAPSYANIFMGELEDKILSSAPHKPLSWLRFIDDIDIKWGGTEEQLADFFNHCNKFHASIKFTHESSSQRISFLDTTTSIKEGYLTTDLHTKETDKHQFLSPKSCHPKHCSRSIPYSQALRIKRICSEKHLQIHRLNELRKHLINRGYKNGNIDEAFDKVKSVDRDSLLVYKEKDPKNRRIPLVMTYHPELKQVSSIIRQHWGLIERDPALSKLFPEPPVMAFRRPKSLRDILVRSKVNCQSPSSPGGYVACKRSNCKCCKEVTPGSVFQSSVTKEKYTIFSTVSCKTENCIYLLTCGTCNIQYVGQTTTTFNLRLNNHRSFNKTEKNCPVTRHLKSTGHLYGDMKIQIIEENLQWDETTRDLREKFWIHQLCTLEPSGLNERDPKKYKKSKK